MAKTSASLSAGDDSVGDNLKALEVMYPEDIDDFNDLLEILEILLEIDPVEPRESPLGPTPSHHDPDNSEQTIKNLAMWLQDPHEKAPEWVEALVRSVPIDKPNWPVPPSNYPNQTGSNILPSYGQVPTFAPLNNSAASCGAGISTVSDSELDPESESESGAGSEPELLTKLSEPYRRGAKQFEEYFDIAGTPEGNAFTPAALGWNQLCRLFGSECRLFPKKLGLGDAKLRYKKVKRYESAVDEKREEIERLKKDKEARKQKNTADAGPKRVPNRLFCHKYARKKLSERASNLLNLDRVYLGLEATAELVAGYAADTLGVVPDTTSSESRTYSPKFAANSGKAKRTAAVDACIQKATTEFEGRKKLLSEGLNRIKDYAERLAGKSCENAEEVLQVLRRVSDPVFDALASGDTKKLEASRTKVSEVIEALLDATDQQSPFEPHRQRVEKLYSDCSEVDVKFSNEGFRSLLEAEEAACNETTTASAPPLGRVAGSAFFQQPPPTKARRIETQTVTSNPTWSADLTF